MLVFTDLETTHLDPHAPYASPLELAVIVTDEELNIVQRASALIQPPGAQMDHDRLWASMAEDAKRMHQASGLWKEATVNGAPLLTVEPQFLQWLKDNGVQPGDRLAGAGVAQFDIHWYRRFFPLIAQYLHPYRVYDVSQTRRFLENLCGWQFPEVPGAPKESAHRAEPDVWHALETARIVRDAAREAWDARWKYAELSK